MTTPLACIGTHEIVAAHYLDAIEDAYQAMKGRGIRHLPIVDDRLRIVGMLSDRDIQRAMQIDQPDFDSGKTPQPEFDPNAKVRDYMSWPIETIDGSRTVSEVALKMIERKISALIVVDREKAIGIITTEDLLKLLIKERETLAQQLKDKVSQAIYDSPIGPIAHSLASAGV